MRIRVSPVMAENAHPARFASTRWSLVQAAAQRGSPASDEALAALCQTYWYPLYAYARRVTDPDSALDLTQEFFARLLEKDYLLQADRERGRFRSFLLTAFKHFLSKEWERGRAQKRGGGRSTLSLDFRTGESRYRFEPVDTMTPEAIYERRWALTLLEQALTQLRQEMAAAGKERLYDCLKHALAGDEASQPYSEIARQLGMSEGAVKAAVHRLRRRHRELLRAAIGETVADESEIDAELRDLFAAVRSKKS
jgi:RNA polymerase sigma-70 factor (ECF subfamily)